MSRPRFSIIGLMALVVLAAADFGAIRMEETIQAVTPPSRRTFALVLCVFGLLPMANALAVVAWRGRRGLGPWAAGFLVGGGAMMATLGATFAAVPFEWIGLLEWVGGLLLPADGPEWVGYATLSAVLTLPQLPPALLAAWFSGRYRIAIERRRPTIEGPGLVGS